MERLQTGSVIDGFTLGERLKAGGMAMLWHASHPDHPGPLVMKIPVLDPGADVSAIIGYETEVLIHKRLSGPHVPRFVAAGDLAAIPYIAMGLVAGESLAERIRQAPLPVPEVQRIGIAIAVALADLHRQQVVHLDLKPENVILAGERAVLLDFGLARHAELPDLLGEESSEPMGTSAYIAPEQVLGERSDPASDLFALGCLLYQMAAGEEPFGRPKTVPGMKRRLYHAPRPLRAVNPQAPAWLEEIVARCLEVDRGRRYADATRLAFDLRHPEQVALAHRRRSTPSAAWQAAGRPVPEARGGAGHRHADGGAAQGRPVHGVDGGRPVRGAGRAGGRDPRRNQPVAGGPAGFLPRLPDRAQDRDHR